jgi:hypothetical protein
MEKASKTKKRKVNPTARQRQAARAVVDNFLSGKPITTSKVLQNVGYAPSIAQHPVRITESNGFKASLAEFGLTEELVTVALVEDIKAKPKNRKPELTLAAEILGMVKREEPPVDNSKTTYNFIFSSEVQSRVQAINEDIKKMLINPHVQKDSQDHRAE